MVAQSTLRTIPPRAARFKAAQEILTIARSQQRSQATNLLTQLTTTQNEFEAYKLTDKFFLDYFINHIYSEQLVERDVPDYFTMLSEFVRELAYKYWHEYPYDKIYSKSSYYLVQKIEMHLLLERHAVTLDPNLVLRFYDEDLAQNYQN